MNILDQKKTGKRISKVFLNSEGTHGIVLFDDSNEFLILNIEGESIKNFEFYSLDYKILDCAFVNKNIIFCGINMPIIEWSISTTEVLRTFGKISNNKLDPELSGYSSLSFLSQKGIIIATNIGNFKIEFFDFHNESLIFEGLCEIYAKQIAIHPSGNILSVLTVENEDSTNIRFYTVDEKNKISLHNVAINTLFAGSCSAFSTNGEKFFINGGYPPLNVQVHQFPSLEFISECMDANEDFPEPWGDNMGITFSNLFLPIGGTNILTPFHTGEIIELDASNGKIQKRYAAHKGICVALAKNEKGDRILSASMDGELILWDQKKYNLSVNAVIKTTSFSGLHSEIDSNTRIDNLKLIESTLEDPVDLA